MTQQPIDDPLFTLSEATRRAITARSNYRVAEKELFLAENKLGAARTEMARATSELDAAIPILENALKKIQPSP